MEPGQPAPVRDRRPSAWRRTIGGLLRAARESRGLRLVDVAARARLSPQYLSEVERGRKEPSSEVLAALTDALDLTLVDLAHGLAAALDGRQPAAGGATVLALTSVASGGARHRPPSEGRPVAASPGRALLRAA